MVCIPLLLVVAYLVFACSSGNEFVLEFVEDARGKEVMPVRCHCSITSLKTTNHGPLFPPMLFWPGCRTSLNRRKEVLSFTFLSRVSGGAGFSLSVCANESGGTRDRALRGGSQAAGFAHPERKRLCCQWSRRWSARLRGRRMHSIAEE